MPGLLLVLAALGGGGGTPPPECIALLGRDSANVWERAKSPELPAYCDLLASAAAKLASPNHIATDVVEIVDRAERLSPGHAAPLVLRGRALARLGRYDAALAAFHDAREREPLALSEPVALLAFARVLAYTAHTEEALVAFRTLLPRSTSLALPDRGIAYVDAGMLAMSQGPPKIEEAVAILREGRKVSQDVVQRVAEFALALALDRWGERAEARVVLSGRPHDNAAALLAEPAAIEALGPAAGVETTALMALALEDVDPAAARSAWSSYLEGPGGQGPWAAHARGRARPSGATPRPR